MQNIFNRKIIFQRLKRINFNTSLYTKIEEIIFEELTDYFLFFNKSEKIENILFLNAKNNLLEKKLNEYFVENKNIFFNYFEFCANDEENIFNFSKIKKNNLIIGINSFHNINNLEKYILEIKNNLENGGIFCGNFFGRETLMEIKKIIIKNDSEFSNNIFPRFNPTISAESVIAILQKFNFQNITISPEKIQYEFNSENSFKDSMNFLKSINERSYLMNSQKTMPSRKIFIENMPPKITLDFEVIKFYCHK